MTKLEQWPEEAQRTFLAFCCSNKTAPYHSLDDQKWNAFVIATFNQGMQIYAEDVQREMIANGWQEDWAVKFHDRFMEYHELLKQFCDAKGIEA